MKNNINNIYITLFSFLFFGLLNIMIVSKVGRLNFELYVDDVGYALTALNSLTNENHIWFNDLLNSHSPYQFILASVGLLIFGYQDSSIYLSNLIPLAILGIIIYNQFRNENLFLFCIVSFFIFSSPITYRLINEFRPDIFYGIILTYALNYSIHFDFKNIKSKFLLIILITLSLYIKPTFILHTFFYIGLILIIIIYREGIKIKSILHNLGSYLIIPLLLSAIIFINRYKGIIDHYINSFKSKGFLFNEELNFFDLFYFNLFDEDYGMVFMGFNLYVFLFLFISSIFLLNKKKYLTDLFKIYLIPIAGFISFLILCHTRVINQHVYSTFHFSIVFSCTLFLSFYWKNFDLLKVKKIIFIYLLFILSIFNIQFYKFNTFGILSNLESIEIGKSDNKDIINIIHTKIINNNPDIKNLNIYSPFYTSVNFLSLNWYYSLINNGNLKRIKTKFLFEPPNVDFEILSNRIENVDILIIPKIESNYIYKFFEINSFLQDTYNEINNLNKYKFKIFQNSNYFIYSRI